jgi:hypothetical protein
VRCDRAKYVGSLASELYVLRITSPFSASIGQRICHERADRRPADDPDYHQGAPPDVASHPDEHLHRWTPAVVTGGQLHHPAPGADVTSLNHGAFFDVGSVVAMSGVVPDRRAGAVATMNLGLTIETIGGVPPETGVGATLHWRAASHLAVDILWISGRRTDARAPPQASDLN